MVVLLVGCLRGNREIRASKTFEYKSSVGIFLAKRFIQMDIIYVYASGVEVKHVL